jgi:predicted transcriptional regulator
MLSSAFNLQEYIATLFKAVSEQFGSMQNDFSLFKQWMVNSLSQTDASTQAVLKSLADYRAALRDAIASKEKLANEQLQLQKQQNEFNQKAVCEKESRDTLQFALNALALINDARDVSTNAERLEEEKRARRERFRA